MVSEFESQTLPITDLETTWVSYLSCFHSIDWRKVSKIKKWWKIFLRQTFLKQDWVAFMSQPYWVEVMVAVELRLRLIWTWGWDEIEWKFSWNWVEVELSWSRDKLTLNKGRNWAFIGVGLRFKICFRSTYVLELLSFSMLLLISSS